MTTSTLRLRLGQWLFAACLTLAGSLPLAAAEPGPTPAQQQAERELIQPGNNAPVWREIRSGISHFLPTIRPTKPGC